MNLRSLFNEKEAVRTGAHGGPGEHVHVEQSEGNASGTADHKGHLLPFLRRSPETVDVHEGPQQTTFASRPLTKVSASPWRRRCDTTPDCSQWISSVVTPNNRKSTSFQSKLRSPCTERALRGRGVPGRPPSWRTWGRSHLKTSVL